MTNQIVDLWALLGTQANALVMASVWSILGLTTRTMPRLSGNKTFRRFKPLLATALCTGAMWIPKVQPEGMEHGTKLLVGIVLGSLCGHAHKVFKRTIMGK